jgi:hypothetical protein
LSKRKNKAGSLAREGVAALALMEEALRLIDSCEISVEIGAHLDLAISRLKEALEAPTSGPPPR